MWEEIYNEDTPVDVWLNRVAWRLEPFPPHPYGTIWLLKDASSDKIYDDIGSAWRNNKEQRRIIVPLVKWALEAV